MPQPNTIFVGIKGSVVALNSHTGEEVWSVHLKGQSFVNVVLDGDNLYATTQGEIFCLDPSSGEGRWHNKLKGLGLGLVTIAGHGIAASPAVTAQEYELRRQQAASSAASAGATH